AYSHSREYGNLASQTLDLRIRGDDGTGDDGAGHEGTEDDQPTVIPVNTGILQAKHWISASAEMTGL
ncbi:MAG: hypothetical protein AB8B87_16650, partial [Granulosicoccus sp.]